MSIIGWFRRHFTCARCGSWNNTMFCFCLEEYSPSNPLANLGADAVAGTRKRLPFRRMSMRETVAFEFSGKTKRTLEVTFGFDDEGTVREIFCAGSHTQSDLQDIIHDACIAASLALQHGARIADLAKAFGELRDEGCTSGPPASPIGAIARAGAALEAEIAEGFE